MPKILIINNYVDPKNFKYVERIKKIVKHSEVMHFTKVTKKIVDSFDAVILSGSRISDREDIKNRVHYYRWIRSVNKPVLGICAGHQIIGETFGAKRFHERGGGKDTIMST